MEWLPDPDWLEFSVPLGYTSVLVDGGSPVTAELASLLVARGWPVTVLSLSPPEGDSHVAFPEGVASMSLPELSETYLQQALAEITADRGAIAAFVYLHGVFHGDRGDGLHFSDRDAALVRSTFFMAKHLKDSLNTAAIELGRSCFLSAVHLDGEFGLGQTTNFSPIGAGLLGLTKALAHEWKDVFCRALDLGPALTPAVAARHILAELHDPDRRLVEVGYGLRGRQTLVARPARG